MHKLPVLGIVAASSNTGKTTVITSLLPLLAQHNIRVSVIKHAHHQFDIDHAGKDSYRIREAGAVQTLIASNQRWAMMTEMTRTPTGNTAADLANLITQINPDYADLILVEGFKQASIDKIEIYRPSLQQPLLADTDTRIIAIASDAPIDSNKPQIALNEPMALCQFIMEWINTQHD